MFGKKENVTVYLVGAIGYTLLELLWRGYSNWTMTAAGGICLTLLYRVRHCMGHLKLWRQCLTGGSIITGVELLAGMILNRMFHMQLWDYSQRRGNIKGQICPRYSFLWCLLCLPVLPLCGWIKRSLSK